MKIRFRRKHQEVRYPIKGSMGAACYDIYADSITVENGQVIVGTGLFTEFTGDYKLVIVPRSNLTKYPFIIQNSPAVIDSNQVN